MEKPNKYQNNINSRLIFFFFVVNYRYQTNRKIDINSLNLTNDPYNPILLDQLKKEFTTYYQLINKQLQQLKEFSKLNPLSVFVIQAAMTEYRIFPENKKLIIQQYINITKKFNPTACNLVQYCINFLF